MVSNSNTCQHGGSMITKGFFGQIFSWCNLFALFIPKTVHSEMHFILLEMHFMFVQYFLKTRGYSHAVSVQDETGIFLSHNFPKREYHAKRYDLKKWFTVASMD